MVEQHVRTWLKEFVVGLNLCPFAKPVLASDSLRISVCESDELTQVAQLFMDELDLIRKAPESEIATTLLVMPSALNDFEEYLSFLDNAENLVEDMGFDGIKEIRQGKYFEIDTKEDDKKKAEEKIKEMCKKLLANLVIENYKIIESQ